MAAADPVRQTYHNDGLTLVADAYGDPSDPAVLFLHGGGQTRHSWGGSARRLAEHGWYTITLDLRGHGESDWHPEGDYRLSRFAADVQAVVAALDRPPVLVGASLGGLTSMFLCGELHCGCARGVVLVDVIPEIEKAGADRIQAFMADKLSEGFASLEEVAAAVAAYNPHRPPPDDLEGLKKNLRWRDGRWYWHWDPKFIGGTADFPPSEIMDVDRLMAAVGTIDVPMMLVRGRMSDIVSTDGARRFLETFPHIAFVDVSDAGHMVAGDRNDVFTEAVLEFLAGVDDGADPGSRGAGAS